jgi:hypothetical protein
MVSTGTRISYVQLNGLFLRIFSLLGWVKFHDCKVSHAYHDLYILHLRGDREVVLSITTSLHPFLVLQFFAINLFDILEAIGLFPPFFLDAR